jgi:flagellin-specific chaperone FliS
MSALILKIDENNFGESIDKASDIIRNYKRVLEIDKNLEGFKKKYLS